MKNKNIKILLMIFMLVLVLSVAFTKTTSLNAEPSEGVKVTSLTYSAGKFETMPQSFEAWIWLPKRDFNASGNRAGSMFSNYDGGPSQTMGFEIFTGGYLDIYWQGTHHSATAGSSNNLAGKSTNDEDYNLWRGEWVNVAIVRNFLVEATPTYRFYYYINGSLVATVNAGVNGNKDDFLQGDDKTKEFFVGTAQNSAHNGTYQPFGNNGYIASLNAWETRRTQAQIVQDMKSNPLPLTEGLLYSTVLNDNTAPAINTSLEPSYTIGNDILPSVFEQNVRTLLNAYDNVSGEAYVNISYSDTCIDNAGYYIPGTYTLYYQASDFAHNTISGDFSLEIIDRTEFIPPSIIYSGVNTIKLSAYDNISVLIDYLNEHVNIIDNVDTNIDAEYLPSEGAFSSNLAQNGYFTVRISATDTNLNNTYIDIDLIIIDGTDFSTAVYGSEIIEKRFQTSYTGELLTIESWINIPIDYQPNASNGNRYGTMLTNYMANTVNGEDDRTKTEGIEIYTNGNIDFYFGGTHHRLTSYDVRGRGWLHVAVVHHETSIWFYADGIKIGQVNTSIPHLSALPLRPYMVGGDYRNSTTASFVGILGNVRAYTTARTDEQILEDMFNPNPSDPTLALNINTPKDRISPTITVAYNNVELENLSTLVLEGLVTTTSFNSLLDITYTDLPYIYDKPILNPYTINFNSENIILENDIISYGNYTIVIEALDKEKNLTSFTFNLLILQPDAPTILYNGNPFISINARTNIEILEEYINNSLYISDNIDTFLVPVITYSQNIVNEDNNLLEGYFTILVTVTDSSFNVTSIEIPLIVKNGVDFSRTLIGPNPTQQKVLTTYQEQLYTIEAWINLPIDAVYNNSGTRFGSILSNYLNNDDRTSTEGLEINANGTIDFYFGGTHHMLQGYDARGKGWIHIAVTHHINKLWYYVNGLKIGEVNTNISLLASPPARPYAIGGVCGTNTSFSFMGLIASVTGYKDARTDEEILNDFIYPDTEDTDFVFHVLTPNDFTKPVIEVRYNNQSIPSNITISLNYHTVVEDLFEIIVTDNKDTNVKYTFSFSNGAYDYIYGWLLPGLHILKITASDNNDNTSVFIVNINVSAEYIPPSEYIPQEVDRYELNNAILLAASKNEYAYTKSSYFELAEALYYAKLAYLDNNITQEEIDICTENLLLKVSNLKINITDIQETITTNNNNVVYTVWIVVLVVISVTVLSLYVVYPLIKRRKK
ncbi:MAG: LamG domain-containing protein [Acholeplasmatales bacterium]|jgi:hypothetical protein|nr:LamG domain-containing protein [Acholeplasmatales bacterium]